MGSWLSSLSSWHNKTRGSISNVQLEAWPLIDSVNVSLLLLLLLLLKTLEVTGFPIAKRTQASCCLVSTLQEWTTSLRSHRWWDFLTRRSRVPTLSSDRVEPFPIKPAYNGARYYTQCFTCRISTVKTVQMFTMTFRGRCAIIPTVQSRKLRPRDEVTCPAGGWAGLAREPSLGGLWSIRREARCLCRLSCCQGISEQGGEGAAPWDQVHFSGHPPPAWRGLEILFHLLSFSDLVPKVILPEPTRFNNPQLDAGPPLPRTHPPILCRSPRRCLILYSLISFPGWWFPVNILKMKGPVYLQTGHFICMALYTLQRLLGPFIYQVGPLRDRVSRPRAENWEPSSCILYLMHRHFLFGWYIVQKLFFSQFLKVERVCIKSPVLQFLLNNWNCWTR